MATDGIGTVKTITVNGLEFGYLEAGSGPLALCLHGFPDTAHTWRHLLPALADAGYHAVAPFLRGYAPTSVPEDGAYELAASVADVTALHDAFGADGRAVLVGHDWGAGIAYGATALAPGRWRRAVTMAVPPPATMAGLFSSYEQIKRSFYVFFFQSPFAEAFVAAADMAFIGNLWRDWSPGYNADLDVRHVKESLREAANLTAALGYYRAMLGTTPPSGRYAAEREALGAFPSEGPPTLYLHGTGDGCLGAELVKAAADELPPGSAMEYVDGAGHFLHLERPDPVNERMVEWITAS